MDYIIGMDCGGTKITAEAFDTKGVSIGKSYGSSGNIIVNYASVLENIRSTFLNLTQQLQGSCQLLVLGIAGIQSSGLEATLTKDLSDLNVSIKMYTDAQLAYLSHFSYRTGILMIAGTGSIAIGFKQQQWYRVGGWGHLLGDEGSGYWIGLTAVQQTLKEKDQTKNYGPLTLALFDHFQVKTVYELVSKFYQANKAQIAELTQIVITLSDTDIKAASILEKAGQKLAQQTISLANNLQLEKVSVLISGSILEKIEQVSSSYSQALANSPINFYIEKRQSPVTSAAVTIWKQSQ